MKDMTRIVRVGSRLVTQLSPQHCAPQVLDHPKPESAVVEVVIPDPDRVTHLVGQPFEQATFELGLCVFAGLLHPTRWY